eukprot:g222.t1
MQATVLRVHPHFRPFAPAPNSLPAHPYSFSFNPHRRSGVFFASGKLYNPRLKHLYISVTASAAVEQKDEETERVSDINRSYYPKKIDTICVNKPWYVIDAEGQILGRLACLVAVMIRGKMNPAYTPSMDMGAFIVVINADKVTVSGKKYTDKIYYKHSQGRPGKEKRESFKTLQNRIPERIIEKAVKGMLPKGRLGRSLHTHLKVYAGGEHPHEAQKPLDITSLIDAKPKEYAKLLSL